MADYLRRSWAAVNLDNLARNLEAIRNIISPGCMVMCVVKADAYGHGDKFVAGELSRLGADWFGVSNIEEAVSLRRGGINEPVLIFGPTPACYAKTLREQNITQSVHSSEYARELDAAALEAGVTLDVHIKADTGMSRLGFVIGDGPDGQKSLDEIRGLFECKGLDIKGIFTHFACADELSKASAEYTKMQYKRFRDAVARLEDMGARFDVKHCCNSAATIRYPEMHMDMVRPGIAVYGLNPGGDCAGKIDIKPVMELYSTVTMVKEIDAGIPVSYGRRYTAKQKITLATVPIGYADGFGRELSNKARMLVRGQFARVIGRVCMDQLMLDVTRIDGVTEGDVVTIVGSDGGGSLSFDEMAELSGTINYEKVCAVARRVPRVYTREGKDVGVVDYITRGWLSST